jgi:branched-chain amino acid transport system permease protein
MKTTSPATTIIAGIGAGAITLGQNWKLAGFVLVLIAGLIFPLMATGVFTFQITQLLIYAIAIAGLNLLTGFNGQFSLGHSAFYAIGAYVSAILMMHYGVPFYLTIPVAAAVCFVFGFLFGLPALRLEGIYLALATFALAIATPQMLKFKPLEELTGGVQGLALFHLKPEAPFGLPLDQDQWTFYVTFAVTILMFFCAFSLVNSRSGRAMKAIRDNQIAAKVTGINLSLFKTLTFGVSALFTGVAGALSALLIAFVAPDSFQITLAVAIFVGMVVGGVGWIPGAFLGALFILFVPNIAEHIAFGLAAFFDLIRKVIPFFPSIGEQSAKGLTGTVYGVFLILLIYVMPSGLAGLLRLVVQRLARARG